MEQQAAILSRSVAWSSELLQSACAAGVPHLHGAILLTMMMSENSTWPLQASSAVYLTTGSIPLSKGISGGLHAAKLLIL